MKMTTAQVVETSVTVNNCNSPIQDYVRPNDHTRPAHEMTPGFKPFTTLLIKQKTQTNNNNNNNKISNENVL